MKVGTDAHVTAPEHGMEDLEALKATAKRLADAATWFTTEEGVEEMLDKSYVAGSVHRSLIVDILHDGLDTGEADPVRTVARALMVLAGETGGDARLSKAALMLEPLVIATARTRAPTPDDATTDREEQE